MSFLRTLNMHFKPRYVLCFYYNNDESCGKLMMHHASPSLISPLYICALQQKTARRFFVKEKNV